MGRVAVLSFVLYLYWSFILTSMAAETGLCGSTDLRERVGVGSVCRVANELPRKETSLRRLAVWQGKKWQFVYPDPDSDTPSTLSDIASTDRKLCLAWEAPKHLGSKRQIVYVSTRYRHKQTLSLARNRVIFPDTSESDAWKTTYTVSEQDGLLLDCSTSRECFRNYHKGEGHLPQLPWGKLVLWHDTLWSVSNWWNQTSQELVRAAVADANDIPQGAERLISLRGKRPCASWVNFDSFPPQRGSKLAVKILFSEEVPHIYKYSIQIK